MRKNSSHSSRDNRKGPGKSGNKFGPKSYSKDAKPFKKNFGEKKPFGQRSEPGEAGSERYPKRNNFKDNRDQEKRPFDKPSYRGGRRDDADGEKSGPRSEFDANKKFDRDKRFDGRKKPGDSRPYSGRVANEGEGKGPRKDFEGRGKFEGKKRFDSDKRDGKDSRPSREYRENEGAHKKPAREFDGDRKFDDRKKFDGDRKKTGDSRPFRERRDSDGPHKKPGREFDSNRKKTTDSRPFRERNKEERPLNKKGFKKDTQHSEEVESKPSFDNVLKNVFQGKKKKEDTDIAKPAIHEDKVYGALPEDEGTRPPKPYETKKAKSSFKKAPVAAPIGRKRKVAADEGDDDHVEITGGDSNGEMTLNKYVSHSGECSRRDAAELVKQGKVKVNGELVLDPGYRVKQDDKVTMAGKKLTPQKNLVYILLNKPRGFITTNEDPQGRKTVMDLVGNSGVERLFPVGRLDRDTSGLLLITNDGELTQKLCHPSYNIKKVYHVTLDKVLTKADFEKIMEGVDLEDGKANVDALAYLEKKNELGLEIHSGRNRIVRRIFESLGYVVDKLDRVMYAGLTKKNLPRSKWRYLNEREIVLLKHFKN